MGQARLTATDHYEQWPQFLRRAADGAQFSHNQQWQPIVISMEGQKGERELIDLLPSVTVTQVVDNYDEQLAELFISQNAQLYRANTDVKTSSIQDYLIQHYHGRPAWQYGSWVYYPWNGQLVHVLAEELFEKLRTIRNKDLITEEEQAKFASLRVGCAGMSVGSNGAAAIALTGGSKKIKLVDGAVLSGSNLNRLRSGVASIGLNKALLMGRQLYELNPYLEVDARVVNLTQDSLGAFFGEPWPLDLVVDEIDDFEFKVRLRIEAKKRRLPLIMVTEPGDGIILDVERFDLDPHLPIFHGLAADIEQILEKGQVSQREFIKYAMMIIGIKNLPLRDQQSMLKVGTKLPSPPQLGSTAMFAGSVIAYAARQIALGKRFKSGRQIISLDKILLAGSGSLSKRFAHRHHSKIMQRAIKSM